MRAERFIIVGVVLALGGCVSATVQHGALIGAGSGLLLGTTTGVLISNDKLLGPTASKTNGDITFEPAATIAAGALVGALFGGLVGAMVGKANEHPDAIPDQPDDAQPGEQSARPTPTAFERSHEARATLQTSERLTSTRPSLAPLARCPQ